MGLMTTSERKFFDFSTCKPWETCLKNHQKFRVNVGFWCLLKLSKATIKTLCRLNCQTRVSGLKKNSKNVKFSKFTSDFWAKWKKLQVIFSKKKNTGVSHGTLVSHEICWWLALQETFCTISLVSYGLQVCGRCIIFYFPSSFIMYMSI